MKFQGPILKCLLHLGLILHIFITGRVAAQPLGVYFDTGVSRHLFKVTELEAIEPVSWGPLLRFGLAVAQSEDEKLKWYAEFRLNFRKFHRNYGSEKFEYRVRSLELPVYGAWNPWKGLHIHFGITPMIYYVNLHSDPDNVAETKTSTDFRMFDIAALTGMEYRINPLIGLGLRSDLGLIPLVKYTPIGDFGEMGEPKTDINYRRFEFFIRWHFI